MTWWELAGIALGLCVGLGGLLLLPPAPAARKPAPRLRGVLATLQRQLVDAGWGQLQLSVVLALWLGGSVALAAVIALLVPIPVLVPLALVAGGLLGRSVLRGRIQARQRRLRRAWPGIVDHIRQAVRSGSSIAEAVVAAGEHVPAELQPAFVRFREGFKSGSLVDHLLEALKDDLADPIADRIIESLRMAYEVGGRELPGVLQSLQASVRADIGVREDALAKQSWIRAASRLGVAAPWLVLLVLSGRQETISAYTSLAGGAIIISGALVSALAFRMMSTLGRLPLERRWFVTREVVAR